MLLRSALTLALCAPLFAADGALTVHEWGTFTSVAGEDGTAERWVSLSPPADLPCFVYHLNAQCVKCGANRVRMETPVVYFYSAHPLTASVRVDLPTGLITEWYPQATLKSSLQPGLTYGAGGNIEWRDIQVSPGSGASFPNGGDASHYYAARATDSAPLRVGGQAEKVLFYRGIADFEPPIQPVFLAGGKLEVRNTGTATIGFALLFENRGGRVGYRIIQDLRSKALLDLPELNSDVESVHRELEGALTAAGLYAKESAAMIETWRDAWFEEGMRIFYLMPRQKVDSELPIKIAPAPIALERVFVGRVEVFSPRTREAIETALATGDTPTLAKYGRFAQPFCDRILQGHSKVRISQAASDFLARARQASTQHETAPCKVAPSVLPTGQR